MAATGDAGIGVGAALEGPFTLRAGDRISVKEPTTGREFAIVGPAQATACDRDMQTLLTRGTFVSARGSGEAPGAEKWVVTPYAVVSYGAALVEVGVDKAGTRVLVKGGIASVLRPDDTSGTWTPVTPRAPYVAPARDAGGFGQACADAQAAEKALDDALPDAGAAFGDLAARAAVARRRARVACVVASLAGSAP